jgi:hypothetical protein
MSEAKPINNSRVRRALDDISFSHREDEDGDIIGHLQADEDVPYSEVDPMYWTMRIGI